MEKNSKWKNIGMVLFIVLMICIIAYNILKKRFEFLEMNITQLITIGIAIVLSYYYTQRRNQDREFNKEIESVVKDIQDIVKINNFIEIDPKNNRREILTNNRQLQNKITVLSCMAKKKTSIQQYVNIIQSNFKQYESMISTNMDQGAKYFQDTERNAPLNGYINAITVNLDYIILVLYDCKVEN